MSSGCIVMCLDGDCRDRTSRASAGTLEAIESHPNEGAQRPDRGAVREGIIEDVRGDLARVRDGLLREFRLAAGEVVLDRAPRGTGGLDHLAETGAGRGGGRWAGRPH